MIYKIMYANKQINDKIYVSVLDKKGGSLNGNFL